MSRKGDSYLGGHTILYGNGRLGLEKPTYGQVKLPDKLWSGAPVLKVDKKWGAWRERADAIGVGLADWPNLKQSLERKIQVAIKSGLSTPEIIAKAWNAEGYKTYSGDKWRRSLVLTASIAVGMQKFLRVVSKSKPFREIKRGKLKRHPSK
jgi:hypothetical protein